MRSIIKYMIYDYRTLQKHNRAGLVHGTAKV